MKHQSLKSVDDFTALIFGISAQATTVQRDNYPGPSQKIFAPKPSIAEIFPATLKLFHRKDRGEYLLG